MESCLFDSYTITKNLQLRKKNPTYQEDATVYVWFLSWMKILLYGSSRDRFSLDAEIQIMLLGQCIIYYLVKTVYDILFCWDSV